MTTTTKDGWTSNLAEFERDHLAATDVALKEVARIYQSEIRRRLRAGFLTGKHVTGRAAEEVKLALAVVTEGGVRVMRVGTNWADALGWELGFVHRLLKRYVRVEKWVPAALDLQGSMGAVYGRTYREHMSRWLVS